MIQVDGAFETEKRPQVVLPFCCDTHCRVHIHTPSRWRLSRCIVVVVRHQGSRAMSRNAGARRPSFFEQRRNQALPNRSARVRGTPASALL